jgi:hypothetical protein
MSTRLRRSTGRGDKDKSPHGFVLLWDVQQLRELLQCNILSAFLLRLSSLFEGGVMMLNSEAVPIIQTLGGLIVRRPEFYEEFKCNRVIQKNIRDQSEM